MAGTMHLTSSQNLLQIQSFHTDNSQSILNAISQVLPGFAQPQIQNHINSGFGMMNQPDLQHLHSATPAAQSIFGPRLNVNDAIQHLASYAKPLIHQAHLTYFNYRQQWNDQAKTDVAQKLGDHIHNQMRQLPKNFINDTISYLINAMPHDYVVTDNGDYFKANKPKLDSIRHISDSRREASLVTTTDGQRYELLNTLDEQQRDFINDQTSSNVKAQKHVIGQGNSFGIVRFARNIATNEIVAVKKVTDNELAQQEFDSMQKLGNKPRLVAPYSRASIPMQNEQDNTVYKHYFFMPFYNDGDGADASEKLQTLKMADPALAEQKLIHTAFAYIESVANLHALGLGHRDIKVDNFFHCTQHDIGLGDFGTAKPLQDDHYENGCGTEGYMPPEIMLPTYTYKSHDSFSLGLALLELKHGVEPWEIKGPQLNILGKDVRIHIKKDSNCSGIPSNRAFLKTMKYETLDEVIAGLLIADPTKRLTPQAALNTPFFRDYALSQGSVHVIPYPEA